LRRLAQQGCDIVELVEVRAQLGKMGFRTFCHGKWENDPEEYITMTMSQNDINETPCATDLEQPFGEPRLRVSGL